MGTARRFEDLEVFQEARELCKEIYRMTSEEPFNSDYRFVQQIRAASGSIMDNIAEGFERNGNKEFVNFLYIAKGSCGEVRSQIIRAKDVDYINEEKATFLYNKCMTIGKQLSSLALSISNSGYAGKKFFGF